mmetsp:Transcript_20075/g.33009  ORF Transcript_20075/g.33009 Transcript_20075/m.33009 type:complete len:295 (+) Transcript_20075:751-1635(+)
MSNMEVVRHNGPPPQQQQQSSSENLSDGEDEKEDADKADELHEGKTSVRSEELADGEHEEGVAMDNPVKLPAVHPADDSAIQSEEEEEAEDDESIGSLTVVKLKELCRERGLKVGGRKADIVQRIKDYDAAAAAAENSVEKPTAAEPGLQKRRGRGRPRTQPLRQALEEHNKTDTPISALTHHSDSEMSDDETRSHESGTESMTRGSRRSAAGQKSIPKDIVTRGKKGSKLPAVPEGETLEGDDETSKPAAASTRRSIRATASVTSRRSTRASAESVASRVSRRSTKGKSKRYD